MKLNIAVTILALLVEAAALAETPPPEEAAKVDWDASTGRLTMTYHGTILLEGVVRGDARLQQHIDTASTGITQKLTLAGKNIDVSATVCGSDESLAAETRGKAQEHFPLVRTSHGASENLRNNAVYDRRWDWELDAEAPATRIKPLHDTQVGRRFLWECSGDKVTLTFRPRFYQKHKGIQYFEPWAYKVRQDSIAGWSSWWAYQRGCTQKDCEDLLAVWQQKHFADYGYRFIQLDDCFQNEFGKGQSRKVWPPASARTSGYVARGPATWLDWRRDSFPAGMSGYVAACQRAGVEPGLWIGTFFTDDELISGHPDWFIQGKNGAAFAAPWASCGVDATRDEALNALVRPTFRGLREAGFRYVKIDQLRHYLYDNLHNNLDYCRKRGVTPAEMFRKYFGAARQELGPEVFLLSCWGVLPEVAGLADACRLGGDGYGPVTMQQYNSWNGIVWRNDPDHCDVYPKFKPANEGNVTQTMAVAAAPADTIIRPALASIAGCLLMLSDKPAVYRDDTNLAGLRRAAPVLFSVPGQLYDFDESKSRRVATMERTTITSGGKLAPCDANQFGPLCPWWLNEIDLPFEHWNVLHRLNWSEKAAEPLMIRFADLGLDPDADYLVYEFWTASFLGVKHGGLELPRAEANELRSYAIRKREDRPQIVSTNRHLTQGGVDVVKVDWQNGNLIGTSRVVAGDRYELALHVPAGFTLKIAEFAGQPAQTAKQGELLRIAFKPAASGEVDWRICFAK